MSYWLLLDNSITQYIQKFDNNLVISHDEANYQKLVAWLVGVASPLENQLIDEVGENEQHPLASLMDIIGVLIKSYENEHIPEL